MREEQKYQEIFEAIYDEARSLNPRIEANIELYIIDDLSIRAFVVGRRAIVITRGAVQIFSPSDLRGIFAHELAHISCGFMKISLFLQGSTFLISAFISLVKRLSAPKYTVTTKNKFADYELTYKEKPNLAMIFGFILVPSIFVFQVLIKAGSRKNEEYADDFAYNLGYGEELISALQVIYRFELSSSVVFMTRLMNTHPPTPIRIAGLEHKVFGDE
jgi:heat shock protein HtpX